MISTLRTLRCAPFAAILLLAACGGGDSDQGLGGGGGGGETDTGGGETDAGGGEDTGATDAGGEDGGTTDTGETDAGETDTGETDAGGGGGLNEADYFYSCESDSECGDDEICVNFVCVKPPREASGMAYDYSEVEIDPDSGEVETIGYVEERPDDTIDLGCYQGGFYDAVDGPATAELHGEIERFGSGPPTNGLCVTLYDETTLLPWMIDSECFGVEDDEDYFVSCFQLDPCRCEEAFGGDSDDTLDLMIEAAQEAIDVAGGDLTIDSTESCFAFVGYCDGIEDADLRATCVERVQRLGQTTDESLIVGFTRSVENEVNPDAGAFSFGDVPTNWRFAYKVSGVENRWRDTWEYGLFTRADLAVDGRLRIDSNAVSAGAWRTIPPAVGFPAGIDDRNGAVAGAIRDCGTAERPPNNIVHATVGFAFLDRLTQLAYFNGNPNNKLPQPGRLDTNVLGLFAAINLPPGPNRVSPVICTENCGPDAGEPSYTFVGSRNVFQTPKSVIIATFEGLTITE